MNPGDVIKTACSVDVKHYPFDIQNCTLEFICWNYHSTEVSLLTRESTVGMAYYKPNGEWVVSATSAQVAPVLSYYQPSTLFFTITLERLSVFFVINIILPIIFLSVLNTFVFILPPESGERVSYTITVLLSISVFLTIIGDNIPKTSKPMSLMSYYLMTNLSISAITCMTTILLLVLYHRDENIPVPEWLCKFIIQLRKLSGGQCVTNSCKRSNSVTDDSTDTINLPDKPMGNSESGKCQLDIPREHESSDEITWKTVSTTLDAICFIVSLVVVVTLTVVFLASIALRV
jgi:hypothetical protein